MRIYLIFLFLIFYFISLLALDQIIEYRGKPKAIRCDNGPEYISQTMKKWALDNGIKINFTQPDNPQLVHILNGIIEQLDMIA